MSAGATYHPGDWVIYRKHKHGAAPGRRAVDIEPEPKGEAYSYCVDKFWVVVAVEGDAVVLGTRRGKQHVFDADDPNLRHARWWERIFFRDRFPSPEQAAAAPLS